MVLVRRGNVELEVNEDFLEQYLNKGFDLVDSGTGKVVKKGTANNFSSLQLAYVELNKDYQSTLIEKQKLQAEIKELQKKVEQLSKKNSTSKSDKE